MDFRRVRDQRDLPQYLGCTAELFERLRSAPDEELFVVHQIPKKGKHGGTREVWQVREHDVAVVYKGLSRTLDTFFRDALPGYPHPSAHAYISGRSTLTNARVHLGASEILIGDIKGFFRAISRDRIIEVLRAAGMKAQAADALGSVLVRQDHVPLGLNTSPLLANAACIELDQRLSALVPEAKYTRYADDLAFSGAELPDREAIEEALREDGFELAEKKFRKVSAGRGLYLTGLSLEDHEAPRVPREMKRRIRQDLHHARERGLVEHVGSRGYPSIQSGINKIHGTIQYIRGIERDVGDRFHAEWLPLLAKSGHSVTYVVTRSASTRPVLFVIDESVISGPTGPLLALALVAIEDVDVVRTRMEALLEERLATPFPVTAVDVLEKEGLHWNSLAPDDRTNVTREARKLPFRAFVAYTALPSEDRATYTKAYGALLAALLRPRFGKYAGRSVTVLAEENDKVVRTTLANVANETYTRLAKKGARRPVAPPSTAVAKKRDDPALALADIVLGIFGDYARIELAAAQVKQKQKTKPGLQATQRFDQVRDRLRAIQDVDARVVYTQRPFAPWPVKQS